MITLLCALLKISRKRKVLKSRFEVKNTNRKGLITLLLSYAKGNTKLFVIAFAGMGFAVLFDLIQPLVFGEIFNLLSEDEIRINYILLCVGALFALLILSSVIQYFQSMSLQKAGQRIIYKMRNDVFNKIENWAVAQINSQPVGKLVTRVTSDIDAINQMYTSVMINLIKNVLVIIGVLIAMFLVNVEMALYVLALTPLVIIASIVFRIFARRAYRNVRTSISKVNANLSENISGIKITQAFNQEKKQFGTFNDCSLELRRNQSKQTFTNAIFRPTIYVLHIGTTALLTYLIATRIIDSNFVLSVGLLVTFSQYIDKIYTPIQQIVEQFDLLQSSLAAGERISEILESEPDIVDEEDAVELTDLKGEIEFKNVWFAYEDENWILKDVSFKINARETCAFVGATGSGKTTILSLIVRNYEAQKGEILIDGINVKDIKLSSLRSKIGQMLQDVFMFTGTIGTNIALREESITNEDILEACKFVNADKIINKMAKGLDEPVLERGNNFSAGERQLISFARVIAHKPNIMILDEATANIDTETEVLIQDSLKKMMNVGTMLIVAHRLSTIQHADKIIVLHKGRILEEGNHQELLKRGGHYYQLYRLQYSDQE